MSLLLFWRKNNIWILLKYKFARGTLRIFEKYMKIF